MEINIFVLQRETIDNMQSYKRTYKELFLIWNCWILQVRYWNINARNAKVILPYSSGFCFEERWQTLKIFKKPVQMWFKHNFWWNNSKSIHSRHSLHCVTISDRSHLKQQCQSICHHQNTLNILFKQRQQFHQQQTNMGK